MKAWLLDRIGRWALRRLRSAPLSVIAVESLHHAATTGSWQVTKDTQGGGFFCAVSGLTPAQVESLYSQVTAIARANRR